MVKWKLNMKHLCRCNSSTQYEGFIMQNPTLHTAVPSITLVFWVAAHSTYTWYLMAIFSCNYQACEQSMPAAWKY